LLAGLLGSLPLEDSAKLGAVVGSFVVEGDGPQDHFFSLDDVKKRYKETYKQALKLG
jgi:sugar/nucleoside kinase (ribokinase family)